MNIDGSEIIIIGGTGSLGKALLNCFLTKHKPKGIRIFSRDELKQWELRKKIQNEFPGAPVSFLIGDIRDRKRIEMASRNTDVMIHCSALKQVPSCENNPIEAIKTNILGSQNVLFAALENNVKKVMAISTDKAVYPINLYGATKLCMERLFIDGNVYSGGRLPAFSCCRYGNVIGSRGSVIPLFKKQFSETGTITITDSRMTRFWIALESVAKFIVRMINVMEGGEIFVPLMPSSSIEDLAKAVVPDAVIKYTGIRPGEKLHETLITAEESRRTCLRSDGHGNYYVIKKDEPEFETDNPLAAFEYSSNKNIRLLEVAEMKKLINDAAIE